MKKIMLKNHVKTEEQGSLDVPLPKFKANLGGKKKKNSWKYSVI